MTTSNEELGQQLKILMNQFANAKPSFPNDEPGFESGVKWGYTLAYYQLRRVLEGS
jgi:hypothetical protein